MFNGWLRAINAVSDLPRKAANSVNFVNAVIYSKRRLVNGVYGTTAFITEFSRKHRDWQFLGLPSRRERTQWSGRRAGAAARASGSAPKDMTSSD